MIMINAIVQNVIILWVASEILITIFRRAKDKSRNFDKSNSLLLWIINIASITIGFNIAAKSGSHVGYPLTSYIGLALIISGIAVRWIAILTLGKQFTATLTIVDNHKIIDSGIYKYIRHPSYTGCLMSFLGLSIAFSNLIAFVVVFIPILSGYIYRIKVEERLLKDHFGEEYASYASRTSRLVPGIY